MDSFYTNVQRYGNNILYRGFHKGKRIKRKFKYEPTLYMGGSPSDSDWKTLDDIPVKPIKFDSMREATDFIRRYEGVDNFSVYGNTNFDIAFIAEVFSKEIKFNSDLINILNMDIEVHMEDGSFPKPEEAMGEISTIALKLLNRNEYHLWHVKPYDPDKRIIDAPVVNHHFRDEISMLRDFLEFWDHPDNSPDIVTGWYLELFDMPYLYNRIKKVLGDKEVKRLSPWRTITESEFQGKKKYLFYGISVIDYLDIFQKFTINTIGALESYKLDFVCETVLGIKKLDYSEHGNLRNLYHEDHQKYCDYNIRDVELVELLDNELGLLSLVQTIAYMSGNNFTASLGTVGVWDSFIYRELNKRKIAIPLSERRDRQSFIGAYVHEPKAGFYDWICSLDLNSLYPNIMIQWNMSPETIIADRRTQLNDVLLLQDNYALDTQGDIVAANGVHFRKDKKGILPEMIQMVYEGRKSFKGKMIEEKKRYETLTHESEKRESQRLISQHDNRQMALKIFLNSGYGAISNPHFRYFDIRVAEAITMTGRYVIQSSAKAVDAYMNKVFKDEMNSVIYMDTDSLYLNLKPLVEKFNPKSPEAFLDSVCEEKLVPMLEKHFEWVQQRTGCNINRMVMAREVIADRGIFVCPKRYLLQVLNNEGVHYNVPKMKIMGLDVKRSDNPQFCRNHMKKAIDIIVNTNEEKLHDFVAEVKKDFFEQNPEVIAKPTGVSDVTKYMDRSNLFVKGTPKHVKASIFFNHLIKKHGLENTYETIKNGTKIKYVPLKTPNPSGFEVMGFIDRLPEEFGLHGYIDYALQFEKTFLDPMENILKAIKWTPEYKPSLTAFL